MPQVRNLSSTGFGQHSFALCQWISIERARIQEAVFLISPGGTCLSLQLLYQELGKQMDASTCRGQRTRGGRSMEGQEPLGNLLVDYWEEFERRQLILLRSFLATKECFGMGNRCSSILFSLS